MEGKTLNIVYLIGNGFDLNQGLKTGFKDFLKFYLQQGCAITDKNMVQTNTARRKLAESTKHNGIDEIELVQCKDSVIKLKEAIREEGIDNWSDLEKKLGEFTAQLSTYEEVEEVRDDIILWLSRYLKIQTYNMDLYDECAKSVIKSFYRPEDQLNRMNRMAFSRIRYHFNEHIDFSTIQRKISIITFNYTNTLERILSFNYNADIEKTDNKKNIRIQFKDITIESGINNSDNKIDPKVFNINHIHGKLEDDSLIIGIDNEKQIINEDLSKLSGVRNLLIKPTINKNIGNANDYVAKEKINTADIVVVYGMSLGETDSTWWNALIDWMKSDYNRCVIIHWYADKTYSGINHAKIGNIKDEIRNKFYSYVGNEELVKSFDDRLLIEINQDVFQKCLTPSDLSGKTIVFDENNNMELLE